MKSKPSLLQVLYDISRENDFLKQPIPEDVIDVLRERGLITTRIGEGPKLTVLGFAALKKVGLEVSD